MLKTHSLPCNCVFLQVISVDYLLMLFAVSPLQFAHIRSNILKKKAILGTLPLYLGLLTFECIDKSQLIRHFPNHSFPASTRNS